MITLTTFLDKTNQFSSLLELSQDDSTKLKEDLFEAIYYDLTLDLTSDPNQKINLDELSKIKPANQEDFNKFMSEVSTSLKDSGYNINDAFDRSARTVLQAFIVKLSDKVPPNKIEGLNKILL